MNFVTAETLGHTFDVVDPKTYPYGDYEFTDEIETKRLYWSDLGPDEMVLDIGASWGGWTLPALAQGARVIAVEPADQAFLVLRENVRANGWESRCRMEKVVLSSRQASFSAIHERDILTTNFPIKRYTPRMPLDILLANCGDPMVHRIKMDVEGAEEDILKSATYTLDRYHPLLIIEDHTAEDESHAQWMPELVGMRERITDMLRSFGYETTLRRPPTGNPFLIARAQ